MLYIYCNHFLLNSIFNKKCVNLATKEHERSIKNAKEERKATYSCKRKSDNINRTSSNDGVTL